MTSFRFPLLINFIYDRSARTHALQRFAVSTSDAQLKRKVETVLPFDRKISYGFGFAVAAFPTKIGLFRPESHFQPLLALKVVSLDYSRCIIEPRRCYCQFYS